MPDVVAIKLLDRVYPRTGKRVGLATGDPETSLTSRDLFDAYRRQLVHFIDAKIRGNSVIERL